MKKKLLNTTIAYQGFAIGLISADKSYRISYFINKELGIFLQKHPSPQNILLSEKPFPELFIYEDREKKVKYLLIDSPGKIKGFPGNKLYKSLDFVFLVLNGKDKNHEIFLKNRIKCISAINVMVDLPFDDLKLEKFIHLD